MVRARALKDNDWSWCRNSVYFQAHINCSYYNDNVHTMCRKRGGQKTVLMNEQVCQGMKCKALWTVQWTALYKTIPLGSSHAYCYIVYINLTGRTTLDHSHERVTLVFLCIESGDESQPV